MKKSLKFWGPPILWMALIFPLWNEFLSGPFLYRLFMKVFYWMFSDSEASPGMWYIVFRKSLHFAVYGILALLLFRSFRAGRPYLWRWKWALMGGGITLVYGMSDEILQLMVNSRSASFLDFLVDVAGAVFALGLLYVFRKNKQNKSIQE